MALSMISKKALEDNLDVVSLSSLLLTDTERGVEVIIKTKSNEMKLVDGYGEPVHYVTPSAAIFSLAKFDLSVVNAAIECVPLRQ